MKKNTSSIFLTFVIAILFSVVSTVYSQTIIKPHAVIDPQLTGDTTVSRNFITVFVDPNKNLAPDGTSILAFETAYRAVFKSNAAGMQDNQINVLGIQEIGGDLHVSTRIEWSVNHDAEDEKPTTTLAWLNSPTIANDAFHGDSALQTMLEFDRVNIIEHTQLTDLQIGYANFPMVAEFILVTNPMEAKNLVDRAALNGDEIKVLLTASGIDGMLKIVPGHDAFDVAGMQHTCTSVENSIDFGRLSSAEMCFWACIVDSTCLTAAFDPQTRVCVGSTTPCTAAAYAAVSENAIITAIKYRNDFVGEEPATVLVSALAQVVRGPIEGTLLNPSPCHYSDTMTNIQPCTWSPVIGMTTNGFFQHAALTTHNVFSLDQWGHDSMDAIPNNDTIYVCPDAATVTAIPLTGQVSPLAECASYLSENVLVNYATYLELTDGRHLCSLTKQCGTQTNPVVAMSAADAGLSLQNAPIILAKRVVMDPRLIDATETTVNPVSMYAIAQILGASIYTDFVQRKNFDNDVGRCQSGLSQHRLYFDATAEGRADVCLAASCGIHSVSGGYRSSDVLFNYKNCQGACCADNTSPESDICDTSGSNTPCLTKTSTGVSYDEIVFSPPIETYHIPDATLVQAKRNMIAGSDITCTIKIDVFDDSSFTDLDAIPVLRSDDEPGDSLPSRVTLACPSYSRDPSANELLVSPGRAYTHVSRKTSGNVGETNVRLISPLAPYAREAGVRGDETVYDFNKIGETNTRFGSGVIDPYRALAVEIIDSVQTKPLARIRIPDMQPNLDGSVYSELPSRIHNAIYITPVDPAPDANVGARHIHVASDLYIRATELATVCFATCAMDTQFSMATKLLSGRSSVFFSESDLQNTFPSESVTELNIDNTKFFFASTEGTPISFDGVHNPTTTEDADIIVLEVMHENARVTYRIVDRQNAVRHGGFCVSDLPLSLENTYQFITHQPSSANYSASEMCTIDNSMISSKYFAEETEVLSTKFPTVTVENEESVSPDWDKMFHVATGFIIDEPNTMNHRTFEVDLAHLQKSAASLSDMNAHLARFCHEMRFGSQELEHDSKIPACLGFSYKAKINPDRTISGDVTKVGPFCYEGRSRVYTEMGACETGESQTCTSMIVENFPIIQSDGSVIEEKPGFTSLFFAPDNADDTDAVDRFGGEVRSPCATWKDRLLQFTDAKLYLTPAIDGSDLASKSQEEADAILGTAVANAGYIVTIDNTVRATVLRLSSVMYPVVVELMAEKMKAISLYTHTDTVMAQAFPCDPPMLTYDYVAEGSVFTDQITLSFMLKSIFSVSEETVIDHVIDISFGKTTAEAIQHVTSRSIFADSYAQAFYGNCHDDNVPTGGYRAYYTTDKKCTARFADEKMNWEINPGKTTYSLPGTETCDTNYYDLRFSGTLGDFLGLQLANAPPYLHETTSGGEISMSTSIILRETLRMSNSVTISRDIFFELTAVHNGLQVSAFTAQSAIIPPTIVTTKNIQVNYDYRTYLTNIEFETRFCVAEPVGTSPVNRYTLMNPITEYDNTRTNSANDPNIKNLGIPSYGMISDLSIAIPGASGSLRVIDATSTEIFDGVNDNRFDEAPISECALLSQTENAIGLSGSDPEFANDGMYAQYNNEFFNFNCYERHYLCQYENTEQLEAMHFNFGTRYVTRSGDLYTVDPAVAPSVSLSGSASVTTSALSELQTFQIRLQVDTPSSLQEDATMPVWSAYHSPDSDGVATLQKLVSDDKTVADTAQRIEKLMRFRVVASLTNPLVRADYTLFPVAMFGVIKFRDFDDTSLTPSSFANDGEVIASPLSDFCGITTELANDENAMSKFGKIVPIYKGLFPTSESTSSGVFRNPTSATLESFISPSVIDPALLAMLKTSNLYASDTVQNELIGSDLEIGGLEMQTGSNSFLLQNNIEVPDREDEINFDFKLCYIGAVENRQDVSMPGGERRRSLLQYVTGEVDLSRSLLQTSGAPRASNSRAEVEVQLIAGSSRSQSVPTTSNSSATMIGTETDITNDITVKVDVTSSSSPENGEHGKRSEHRTKNGHDDHDSKRMTLLLGTTVAICSVCILGEILGISILSIHIHQRRNPHQYSKMDTESKTLRSGVARKQKSFALKF